MTFPADQIIWIDFEVRAPDVDLKASGAFRYVAEPSTQSVVLAYAVGDEPVVTWHADGAILDWNSVPDDLRAAFTSGATFAAWNAGFDSACWNYATLGFPFLRPERVIDVMVQAGVSNLPTDLEHASRYLGGEGKQADGKKLIKLFCFEGADPRDYPEEWQRFLAYARRDVEAMRDVYRRTRPLPLCEWQQYWAFERVNRRGVLLDMPFVHGAAVLTAEDAVASGRRLIELTDNAVTRVTQAKRIATWLHDQLPDAAMREILAVGVPADDNDSDADNDEAEPQELSLTRDRVARVLAMLDVKRANGGLSAEETKAREAAELRLFGAGASPKKFARIIAQQVDGIIRDQYRFAGAGQTGRASGKGIQLQNLSRDVLGEDGAHEAALIDMIADGCSHANLAAASPADVPVARKLALLVRPALIAAPKRIFVWSDWSAIEARITPWLAASEDAERILDIFRANDADPRRPDVYTIAAADILHKDPREITKTERGIGKVVILACIAEGELVLTDSGLVPIEKVTTAMRVWDGIAWVNHDGVAYRGVRDVFTYNGLTATGDHVVYTTQGKLQLGVAAARGAHLIQSGAGRTPIRACENHFSRTALRTRLALSLRRDAMHRMRRQRLDMFIQPYARDFERLPAVLAATTDTTAARSYSYGRERPLYDENPQTVDELRRTRHRVSLSLSTRSWPLGFGEHRRTPFVLARIGSNQQRRSLRARKPALGNTAAADVQQAMQRRRRMGIPRRRVALRVLHRGAAQTSGADARGYPGASSTSSRRKTQELVHNRRPARVFDILNAGPCHRFTVSDRLVHNCGFGGSVGALSAMALSYRIHLDDAEARRIVDAWREANSWAPEFWGAHRDGESYGLWGAAMSAWELPGQITTAGRIAFVYREDYLGGTLFMGLPSGRLLTYPRPRWREVDVVDRNGNPTGEKRTELSFRRARRRAKLWHGTFCENAVQATAADLLRATVTRIETDPALAFMPIRLHTHDEIVCEAEEARAEKVKAILRREMLTPLDWATGLPLQSEEQTCRWYTKSKAALGDKS